jgi:N-acyl homoserine lactone hydrolase
VIRSAVTGPERYGQGAGGPSVMARLAVRLVAGMAVVVLASGCSDPLVIPTIEPVEAGLTDSYTPLAGIRIHAFNTGSIQSVEAAVWAGGSWTDTEAMEVFAFVIEHPKAGLVVFDTGLSPRAASDPGHYVGAIGRELGMVEASVGQDLPSQMREAGMNPDDVTLVVISHLHFDHTGTIEDFPDAEVVIAAEEINAPRGEGLMPDFVFDDEFDQVSNWRELDYEKGEPLATFVSHFDLIGDGSLLGVALSGHTAGSQGLLVRTDLGSVLLTGDAAWTEKSWRYAARPITAWSMAGWWEQAWRIRRYWQLAPRSLVIPGHDAAAVERSRSAVLISHRFGPSALES